MPYPPKPKKETTRASIKDAAAEWDFFPSAVRRRVIQSVTAAVDAHHGLSRPDPGPTRSLREADLPVAPRARNRGRPSSAAVDHLVSGLAHIYRHKGAGKRSPTRAWDLADPTEFEKFVGDVFRIAGIEEEHSSKSAVRRYLQELRSLPYAEDGDGMIFAKLLKYKQ